MRKEKRIDERSLIACEILTYLSEHPAAEDTLEGIMHWWLLEQKIKHWTAEVQAALAELVDEGLVLERRGRDGRARYCIDRRKVKEVDTLVKRAALRRDKKVTL